ncbi:MAG TPA: glucose-6-phosphate dehydrogenase assembly protein OpcA [Pyrinomonadaceae bacterium]|jgi:glucose-6-phosphate dehydrogenase assembly protein OpcA
MLTEGNAVPVSTAKGIDVERIEKELASMWIEAGETGDAASSEAGGGAAGVARACALNLIVYTTKQDDRARLEELLKEVSQQHPGRMIVLVADAQASEASLNAFVSTRCRLLSGNRRQVCGEQVTIEAGGQAVSTAASAALPLLVPDVPVFLWWKDIPHYEDRLFNRLAAMADRVVIDSAAFDHPQDDLLRLAQILRERSADMRVSDLNWGRLTSWRTLLASFWDVPDYRAQLDRIDHVLIEYDPPDVAREEIAPKALLVIGWLASRLGWQVVSADAPEETEGCAARFTLSGSQGTINLQFCVTTDREDCDGMLASLKLSAQSSGAEFYVALSPERTRLQTEAIIGGQRTAGRVLSYEARTEGERLGRELAFLTRDMIYEEAVAVSARLIEAMAARK